VKRRIETEVVDLTAVGVEAGRICVLRLSQTAAITITREDGHQTTIPAERLLWLANELEKG
jgi:hypothetical protein